LKVITGGARVFINAPSVLDLTAKTEEDIRLAMVLCRCLFKSNGKKNLLTYQKIASSFGKKTGRIAKTTFRSLKGLVEALPR
jgi:hypothetical protein